MRRRYHILDVFTDTKLTGNPLAVVLDSDGLDAAAMQAIAREFNLSETIFCTPPRDAVNTAAVRIFTPTHELPFAGHPTIGTAILLAKLNAPELLAREDVGLVLEEAIGPVSCSVRHRRGEAAHARFEVPSLARQAGEAPASHEIAAMLGLPVEAIGFARHRPIRVSAGVPFLFVPLASLAALGDARAETGEGAFYLYTPTSETAPRGFRARMLGPGVGIREDPATGSAAAAFAGVLLANEVLADGEHDCLLHQGVEMGRPSRIGLAFRVENGELVAATIGGSAVMVAEGVLDL
jgi:trans-2,3-dihydro-3-hydroxyanthranilate isomerase